MFELKFRKKLIGETVSTNDFRFNAKKIGITIGIIVGVIVLSRIYYLIDRNANRGILMKPSSRSRYSEDDDLLTPSDLATDYDSSNSSVSKGSSFNGLLNAIEDSLSMSAKLLKSLLMTVLNASCFQKQENQHVSWTLEYLKDCLQNFSISL